MKNKNTKARKAVGNPNDEIRLKLLVLLPSFQRLVARIRLQFKIPSLGFVDKDAERVWWSQPNQQKRFDAAIEFLCAEFNLPEHFMKIALKVYALENKLIVPNKNWVMDVEWESNPESLEARHVALKVYGPLTKRDYAEINAGLRQYQKLLPKSPSRDLVKIRNFERDIKILESFMGRSGHPVLRKQYVPHSYLSIVKKQGADKKKLRQLEKQRKREVSTDYDQMTSRKIGKKLGASPVATRKAAERLNKLSKELFGVAILEDKNRTT